MLSSGTDQYGIRGNVGKKEDNILLFVAAV